ncbi:recombination protein U [Salirhabdus euzebyi]|uniref:Holliday junction resolvase RecU n=1 Tax=Salirhabdus euzebyi TaxID=394506 RepID=A0A841PW39_9BACI|nr:Holliday junction resolvase RecU [Salirhabdus euzebyi]MBB6452004.1 recombination protein U [Salirhabdus euzebyi]
MNHGRRGMSFENTVNYTNNLYNHKGKAIINKRPTPMKIIGKTRGNQHLCIFSEKSTVDYDGIYLGKPVVFEAKTTKLKRFPLDMITDSQVEYLQQAEKHGAVSFVLIEMRIVNDVFLIPNNMLQKYLKAANKGARKSIPLQDLEIYAHLVTTQNGVPLDYLSVVDKLIKEGVA